ncbi:MULTISPECIES: hypothetical protein [Lysinibacillus]|uniref:Uncharacterized protein n=1 Tax=Lysinibacillus antri TaxID=2498145 RepID=A0A432LFZ6_9BACI|nr:MULTISPECIES: hypothetical protein [Lysinibacillus]RUL55603.1 hypothetical protein EK386_04565 [Lysinibacillus antri]TSI11266.1 hypothetical protein FJQ64_01725 [Lysinibacillus sp. BW-2-10]
MDIKEIISSINHCVDQLDFTTARRYIEDNIELVNKERASLKSNAREILKFILEKNNSGEKPLTKKEINEINVINTYAARFDIRGLKLNIKGKEQLLLKDETLNYLSADAKIILEGMGAIKK